MTFEFKPETHEYLWNGVHVPSVTQILSASGFTDERWFRGRNRGKGTAVHEGCSLVDRGEWDAASTHPDIVPHIQAYESFCRDTGFKAELIEQPLLSTQWHFAGTADRWGWANNGTGPKQRWLVDLKSGSRTAAADIQIALYDVLVQEQLQYQTDFRVVLILKDDGRYKIDTIPDGQKISDVSTGLAAVRVWHWRNSHGKL